MAASADHTAAAARQRPQARPGRRPARRCRARGRGHRARGDRRGAADPGAARGTDRRGRGAHAGPGHRPSARAGQPARAHRARPDGRARPCLRAGPRLARCPARAARGRSTGTGPWPSLPPATWPATALPPTATWPSGPGCRCATPGAAWPRSPGGSPAATTVSRTWPGGGTEYPLPPPRLLGAYDPLLLGWDSRDPVVGPHGRLIAINGLFRPFALVRGRAVGTWSLPGGKVALAPFAPLPGADAAALAADAAEVERFLRPRPEGPSPARHYSAGQVRAGAAGHHVQGDLVLPASAGCVSSRSRTWPSTARRRSSGNVIT